MKRASTAIAALLLVALAVFILIPRLNNAANRLIGASISSMQAQVESVRAILLVSFPIAFDPAICFFLPARNIGPGEERSSRLAKSACFTMFSPSSEGKARKPFGDSTCKT